MSGSLPAVEVSPRLLSGIGGVLYLIIIVLGVFQEAFVRGRVIVSGNAPAFAARLFPAIFTPAFVGETAFALWLLVRGVRPVRENS